MQSRCLCGSLSQGWLLHPHCLESGRGPQLGPPSCVCVCAWPCAGCLPYPGPAEPGPAATQILTFLIKKMHLFLGYLPAAGAVYICMYMHISWQRLPFIFWVRESVAKKTPPCSSRGNVRDVYSRRGAEFALYRGGPLVGTGLHTTTQPGALQEEGPAQVAAGGKGNKALPQSEPDCSSYLGGRGWDSCDPCPAGTTESETVAVSSPRINLSYTQTHTHRRTRLPPTQISRLRYTGSPVSHTLATTHSQTNMRLCRHAPTTHR